MDERYYLFLFWTYAKQGGANDYLHPFPTWQRAEEYMRNETSDSNTEAHLVIITPSGDLQISHVWDNDNRIFDKKGGA